MKIGIDLDDTTFITVKSMLKYADKFELEKGDERLKYGTFNIMLY